MKKLRVYISGAITGRPYSEALKQFAEAEKVINLSDRYEAVNPAKTGSHALDWFDNMTIALNYLRSCDMIYFLPNAEKSQGAQVERIYSWKLGIDILTSSEYSMLECLDENKQYFICIATYTDASLDYSIINEGDMLIGSMIHPTFKDYYRKATDEEVRKVNTEGRIWICRSEL